MLTSLLLAAIIAAPLDAKVVDIDLQRVRSEYGGWYNRVQVEFASATEQRFEICPRQATVSTARIAGDRLKKVDSYAAHALTLGPRPTYTSQCRDLTVRPDYPQRVTFFIRGVPGQWRGEDRYAFTVDAGTKRFTFVQAATATR